jgi:hypothetical protein
MRVLARGQGGVLGVRPMADSGHGERGQRRGPGRGAGAAVECGAVVRRGANPRPAHWAAAHASLDDPAGVADLLGGLRKAGAGEHAAALTTWMPTAGMFRLFLEQEGHADKFRFGREPDGTPAAPWDWDDLDLSPCPLAAQEQGRASAAPAEVSVPDTLKRRRADGAACGNVVS